MLPLTSVDMGREVDLNEVFPQLLTAGYEASLAVNSDLNEDESAYLNFATHRGTRLGFTTDPTPQSIEIPPSYAQGANLPPQNRYFEAVAQISAKFNPKARKLSEVEPQRTLTSLVGEYQYNKGTPEGALTRFGDCLLQYDRAMAKASSRPKAVSLCAPYVIGGDSFEDF